MSTKPTWVLISGPSRSGTTLLRTLLNSHPNAAIFHEYGMTLLVRRLWSVLDTPKFVLNPAVKLAENQIDPLALSILERSEKFRISNNKKSGFNDLFLPTGPRDKNFSAFAVSLFSIAFAKSKLKVIGDKVPLRGPWEDLAYLMNMLPDLKFVFIIRNPLDVIDSSLRRSLNAKLGNDEWSISNFG